MSRGLAMATKSFECTVGDGLAHIVLDRAERGNPIDGEFCREFSLAIAELSERADVRALLLSARGRLFSVGGDLTSLISQGDALPTMIKVWTADLHVAIARMVRMRAPVVAAIHGNVAGGSVSLMVAADLVVMAETAKISAAFSRIGFSPDSGSTTTVTRRIGVARARRFFLLGETLDAKSALALGLVDFVVPADAVQSEAARIAGELAVGPTEAFGAIKRLFSRTNDRSFESQLEDEAETLAAISRTADAREGVRAFVEKRKPVFAGE
ncbi:MULTISPECIES: enoyl-CoA hydratase/isomerase family protein [unclassified Bradyrhizobium]